VAFSEVITAIATELQYVASTVTDPRKVTPTTRLAPPLYVWERQSVEENATEAVPKDRLLRAIGVDSHVSTVHCWGATEDDAEWMRAALKTVLRNQLLGRNYRFGPAQWTVPEWTASGYVLSQQLTIWTPLVAVVIPTEEGTGIPGTDVTNDTATTVVIDEVAHDPTGADDGDGYLQTAGEP
jgi:hypothetical protein